MPPSYHTDPRERTCPDCSHRVELVEATHCPHCGQRLAVGPLRLGELVAQVLGSALSFELPILRTARDLFRGPGRVASAWIGGCRTTYVSPIQWIVVVGVVAALAYVPLHDLVAARSQDRGAVYQIGLAHYAPQYLAFLCIGALVPIALLVRALGRPLGLVRPWVHWYVLGLYAYGVAVVVQLALNVAYLVVPHGRLLLALWIVEGIAPAAALAWGALQFVPRGRGARAGLVVLVAQLLFLVAVALVEALVSRLAG